jgi:hypothetical protein
LDNPAVTEMCSTETRPAGLLPIDNTAQFRGKLALANCNTTAAPDSGPTDIRLTYAFHFLLKNTKCILILSFQPNHLLSHIGGLYLQDKNNSKTIKNGTSHVRKVVANGRFSKQRIIQGYPAWAWSPR